MVKERLKPSVFCLHRIVANEQWYEIGLQRIVVNEIRCETRLQRVVANDQWYDIGLHRIVANEQRCETRLQRVAAN